LIGSANSALAAGCKRLERLSRERRLPPVALGHTLCPADGADSLGALVSQARTCEDAGLTGGWKYVS
jgi:hypothetical protein